MSHQYVIELFNTIYSIRDVDEEVMICISPSDEYYYLVNRHSCKIYDICYDINTVSLYINNYKLAKEFMKLINENFSNITVYGKYHFMNKKIIDSNYGINYVSNDYYSIYNRQNKILDPGYTNIIDLINAAHKNELNSTDSTHLFNLPSAQWHNFLRT